MAWSAGSEMIALCLPTSFWMRSYGASRARRASAFHANDGPAPRAGRRSAAAMMLAVFAAFGGVGFAASGASNAASSTVDAILTVAKPAKAKPAKPETKSVRAKLTSVQATPKTESVDAELGAEHAKQGQQPQRRDDDDEDDDEFGNCGHHDSVNAANGQYCPPRVTISATRAR